VNQANFLLAYEVITVSYTRTDENCGLDFPPSGLAGVVKANSPQAAKPRLEEFVFPTTAKP
jgi:hypothetical protein